MKRDIFFISALVLFLGTAGWGQDSHTVPAAAVKGGLPVPDSVELPYSEVLTPPMPVSSLRMPLTFSSDTPRSNYVMGSLQFGAGYDDNLLASPSDRIGDESYLILPNFDIAQSRGHWNWDLGYSAGFTINQHVTELNQAAQYLYLLMTYRLSPHVTAQVRENFEKTNSLFSGLLAGPTPTAGPGPLQQPNTTVVTPFANRTGNTTSLDLTYQFSRSSLLGASGNFYFVNYAVPPAYQDLTYHLIDTQSWGGNAFYAHQFSNRDWAGVTYDYQRMLFSPGYPTDVNRLLLFYSIAAGSRFVLSIWAGPEYATSLVPTATTPASDATTWQSRWDVAGGAELSWQGNRTSFRVGYTRKTTDGGGLAEAVNLQEVHGEIAQRLTPRWTGNITSSYGKNSPLNNSGLYYRSFLARVGLDCKLTANLALGLNYKRDQLDFQYSGSPPSYRNQGWVSITYSFSRPVGR